MTLVLLTNEQELTHRVLHATIDSERARGDRMFEENQRLLRELDQVKLELKLERQNKFATSKQNQNQATRRMRLPTPPQHHRRTRKNAVPRLAIRDGFGKRLLNTTGRSR